MMIERLQQERRRVMELDEMVRMEDYHEVGFAWWHEMYEDDKIRPTLVHLYRHVETWKLHVIRQKDESLPNLKIYPVELNDIVVEPGVLFDDSVRIRTNWFDFDHLVPERDGYPVAGGREIMHDLPPKLFQRRTRLVKIAGMDPDVIKDHIGLLVNDWKQYKRGALVISPTWNFHDGQTFAISRQSVYLQPHESE